MRPKAAFAIASVVAVGFAVQPPSVGDIVLPVLEHRFARAEISDPNAFAGVIALGGNYSRYEEAGRLARAWPHLKVLLSNGVEGYTEDAFAALGGGIAPERVTIETHSRTTYENATYAREILGSRRNQRWLLVTSAFHMPRAVGAFRKAGINVTPWPVYDSKDYGTRYTGLVLHEVAGMAGYWALGRSSSLFPAPAS